MTAFKLKNLFILGLIVALGFFAFALTPSGTLAIALPTTLGGGGGASTDDPIAERENKDKEQTRAEAEKLDELQRQDYEQCTAETNGSSPAGSPGGSSGEPAGDSTPASPGSGWNQKDEDAVRKELAEAGVTVNKKACQGKDYRTVNGGCTDVAGLPRKTIDRLKGVSEEIGPFELSGGTEAGHSAHGIGNNVVDVGFRNEKFNDWVYTHTTGTTVSASGYTIHQLDNGDQILREGDHFHWRIQGKSSQSVMAQNSKKITKKILAKIKSLLLSSVQAANSQSIIMINDRLVDVSSSSGTELEGLLLKLPNTELNNLFSQMSTGNIQTVMGKLPFNGLNQTVNNLNPENINRLVGSLSGNNLNNLISNLTAGGDAVGSSGSLDHLFSNLSGGNLSGLLNNLNSNSLGTVFSNINSGSLNSIFSNLNGGLANDLIGQLGQGSLNNIFGNLSGNLFNQVVGGLGMSSLNNVFKQVSGFGLDKILGNLTSGTLNSLFSSLGQSTITSVFTTAAPEILNGALGQMAPDMVADIASRLPTEVVTDLAEKVPALAEALPTAGITIPGLGENPVTSLITGGLYVPVVEQNGQLMQLTKSIDKTDKEIKDLSVQICTHLRAIRRIQSRFELKEFAAEVGTLRTRATEVEEWRRAMIGENGWLEIGGKDAQGNQAPLYVTNLTDYQAETKQEAEDRVLADIANSDNAYKDQILKDIREQEAYGFPFNTTITTEELKKLAPTEKTSTAQGSPTKSFALSNIPIVRHIAKPFSKIASLLGVNSSWAADPAPTTEETGSEEKWNIFLKLMEPRNNRFGSFIQAISQLEKSKSIASENARDTFIAGQGFLPTRTCEEWGPKAGTENSTNAGTGEDMVCLKWKTEVPAIINKENYTSALNARRDQYISDPRMGSTGPGNGPDVEENATGKPKPGGGGAPGPGSITSASDVAQVIGETRSDQNTNVPENPNNNGGTNNPGGNGNPNGNGNQNGTGGADWSNFGDLFDLIMGGSNSPSSDDLDYLQLFLKFLAEAYNNQKPLVHFKTKTLDDNQSLLYWASPNATNCTAGNDWLSQTETASTTPKKQGESLGKNGNLTITYPSFATTSLSVSYKINCQNTKGTESKSVTIEKR